MSSTEIEPLTIFHPADPQNVAIRASAGSGKTFALTRRYLRLLLSGVSPESIMASTFTRKAAGEILARVVGRLADAVRSASAFEKLRTDLDLPSLSTEQLEEVFTSVVARLGNIKIGTLDRFFAQAARTLALDLTLPLAWSVLDQTDEERLRRLSVGEMLATGKGKDLAQLCRLLSKGEVLRGVHRQVDELVTELHEVLAETPESAWQAIPVMAELEPPEVEYHIDELARFPILKPKTLVTARDNDVQNARAGYWLEFVRKGIGAAVAANKTTYSRSELPPGLFDRYLPLVGHATAVLRNRLCTQNVATRDLLTKFDRFYRERQFRTGSLRFSDVTMTLASAIEAGAEIWPEATSPIRHLLVDEFQDTSTQQWQVIRPLAQRCASSGGSFFCVGDPKQAIYRWRGGVAELFDAIPEDIPNLSWQELSRSYRSSPVIIDFVNAVFRPLADNPVVQDDPRWKGVAFAWGSRFPVHESARPDREGYVQFVVAPAAEDDADKDQARLAFAASEVKRLRVERPTATIGILVRDNAAVATLLHEIRSLGLSASEEGGNPLSRSPAVSIILSFLDWLDHPGNSASLFHVQHSPLGERLSIGPSAKEAQLDAVSHHWRSQLSSRGYAGAVRELVKIFSPGLADSHRLALERLAELAIDYEDHATLRPADFVRFVESTKVDDPQAASIRVMTIHQAKGLEFDIVLLPQLDKLIKGHVPSFVAGRDAPTGPIRAVCRYTNEAEQALLPETIQQMFSDHWRGIYAEGLCLLYVAITRAVHALHLIIQPAKENEKKLPATFAGVLRGAVAAERRANPGVILHEAGRADWSMHDEAETESPSAGTRVLLEPLCWKQSVRAAES